MTTHERKKPERFSLTVPTSVVPGPRFVVEVEGDESFLDNLTALMSAPDAPMALLAPDGPNAPDDIANALARVDGARVVAVTRRDAHP